MPANTDETQTPERSRDQLLAAASAAGAAITGIVEILRTEQGVEAALSEGLGYSDEKAFLPLQEEVLEPLIDALRLTIHAVGLPAPLHRLSLDIDRFLTGDDA